MMTATSASIMFLRPAAATSSTVSLAARALSHLEITVVTIGHCSSSLLLLFDLSCFLGYLLLLCLLLLFLSVS